MRYAQTIVRLGLIFSAGCSSANKMSSSGSSERPVTVQEVAERSPRVPESEEAAPASPPSRAPKERRAETPVPPEPPTSDRYSSRRRDDPSASLEGAVPERAAPTPDLRTRTVKPRRPPPPSGVKAGAADDNVQFNAFLRFLRKSRGLGLPFPTQRRVMLKVTDAKGRPWPGARVEWVVDGEVEAERRTYSDGRAVVFPRAAANGARLRVSVAGRPTIERPAPRRRAIEVKVPSRRPEVQRVPLDVAFVLDTTGSMQDEIDRLRATLNTINFQISNATPRPDVRYGLVLYRDQGEAYRVKTVPFTRDLTAFSGDLARVTAAGGDDYPEDVQAGLRAAIEQLSWIDHGVKLAFLIGDAPPHLDYGQSYTYLEAAQGAAERGIKIATIGASGLNRTGEVVWRQIAQQTMAPFVFLTYGETGDSEGSVSSVSHHVGANWVADDLDAIVIRLVKQELAHWRPKGAPQREDFFIARPNQTQSPEQVLDELFRQSTQQLVDYSIEAIRPLTPTVLLPIRAADLDRARMLERRLAVGLSRQGRFQLVERDRRKDVLSAIADQMAKAYDEDRMIQVGKMVPAKLAVLGSVDPGPAGRLDLLVKLVRLETGEVLSLSLLRIDGALL